MAVDACEMKGTFKNPVACHHHGFRISGSSFLKIERERTVHISCHAMVMQAIASYLNPSSQYTCHSCNSISIHEREGLVLHVLVSAGITLLLSSLD